MNLFAQKEELPEISAKFSTRLSTVQVWLIGRDSVTEVWINVAIGAMSIARWPVVAPNNLYSIFSFSLCVQPSAEGEWELIESASWCGDDRLRVAIVCRIGGDLNYRGDDLLAVWTWLKYSVQNRYILNKIETSTAASCNTVNVEITHTHCSATVTI